MSRVTQVIPFEPAHRHELREATAAIGCDAAPAVWERVAEQGNSITLRIDGRTVMCGGVVEYEPGKFEAWAAIDFDSRRHALTIHRVAKRVLKAAVAVCGRVRALVVFGFFEAHEWVRRLGFVFEKIVDAGRPDRRVCALYWLGAA